MNLDLANRLISTALECRRKRGAKPMTVAVIDAGGHLVALQREDGTSNLRAEIAQGKAKGAIAMGLGSRALYELAQEQPYFNQAETTLQNGDLIAVPGGVLIREQGKIIAAINAVGLEADAG